MAGLSSAAMSETGESILTGADGPVLFGAELQPHRSLSGPAFAVLMGVTGAIAIALGVAFVLVGAWPIFGFFGLDVLLLYVAFRINYRRARLVERLRLTPGDLTVERVSHRGARETWRFQPYWLRVTMDDPPRHDSALTLSSHGRSLVIGAFLTPEERLEVADALRAALARVRGR